MRPANPTLKVATLAMLTLCAAAASAITPAPPVAAMGPIGAASAAAPGKALTSVAVQAVPMGRPTAAGTDQAKKAAVGTIAELEGLQRQTALAEARKRLQELSQGAPDGKPAAAAAAATAVADQPFSVMPESQPPKKSKQKKKPNLDPASAALVPAPTEVVQMDSVAGQPPTAKLVNLLVVGGRARADVLDRGRMLTIKEGDLLSKWTVASITTEGVTVEYRYTVDAPVHSPMTDGMRPAIAEAFPAAYALAKSRRASEAAERVKTVKLESATSTEIAASSGAAPAIGGPLPPAIPQATPMPIMAGGNAMADSTSIPPVPPLPAPLGGSNGVPLGQR
tara:strand:+ start:3506 stop:4516 length:1011 start_codon:yes stop_codon:yes gene_type:complete